MYKQQAALRQQRAKHAPIREHLEEVPEEEVAAAEADDEGGELVGDEGQRHGF